MSVDEVPAEIVIGDLPVASVRLVASGVSRRPATIRISRRLEIAEAGTVGEDSVDDLKGSAERVGIGSGEYLFKIIQRRTSGKRPLSWWIGVEVNPNRPSPADARTA